MKKNLNKILLEAINRGINLALDDFDSDELIGQQTQTIKDQNITKDYLELLDLFKQVDEIIRIIDSYSSKNPEAFVLNLNKIKFNNDDLSKLNELSKKLDIKYKINPDLITNAINQQHRSSDGLKILVQFIINYLKNDKANLNWINTSNVEDMQYMFEKIKFNGDISEWNTSNCQNMRMMFKGSIFNGDISRWDVSHVKDMEEMFRGSKFNQPIKNWDVSKVHDMSYMFKNSKFNQDISNWEINTWYTFGMFDKCKIEERFKPKLKH